MRRGICKSALTGSGCSARSGCWRNCGGCAARHSTFSAAPPSGGWNGSSSPNMKPYSTRSPKDSHRRTTRSRSNWRRCRWRSAALGMSRKATASAPRRRKPISSPASARRRRARWRRSKQRRSNAFDTGRQTGKTGAMKRQLHLNLFMHSRGHHEASWRHPNSSPLPLTDIRYYQDLAQRAEAALFDSIFLADQLALGEDVAQAARTWLEPITVLAAVAVATHRVGLIATASTTYTEPFNLARQFASLDHMSNGRIGWNIVTSWLATAADNYGDTGQISHA